MKKSLAQLFLLLLFHCAYAQDSIPVTFRQEPDTLTKQRFIDRYENVFMTKVPTKQMFKLGTIASLVQGIGISLGYEYKVFPSLSIEASVYSQLNSDNVGLAYQLRYLDLRRINFWANAKARWYYNMNKRIESGQNANNFSGAYVGFTYEQSVLRGRYLVDRNDSRFGFLYGFQSRFFNNGFIDFSLGLYQKEVPQRYGFFDYQDAFN